MTALDQLAKLREPFPAHQVNLLPKQMKKDDQDRGRCEVGSRYSADGKSCGGYHARSIHLDYVGHAALTDRFLEVDPMWTWEPLAFAEDGSPAFDRNGGMWIRLTICGVTRLGYGDAQGKSGGNAVKEAIGDALRNAGMRFGAALDLWHKGDLHDADDERGRPEEAPAPTPAPDTPASVRSRIAALGKAKNLTPAEIADDFVSWSQGTKIGEAKVPELLAYLDYVNAS